MPAGRKTSSFILELPLKTDPAQDRSLLVRLDCARQLYNACLGECLKRLRLIRDSKDFQKALRIQKGKKRAEAFNVINEKFGFRAGDIHKYTTKGRNACHIGEHLDANTCQTVATRAFRATQQYAFGKRGKPRFKGAGQFDSVEGKTNKQGIRWKDGRVHWDTLELPVLLDPIDKHKVQAHGLASPVKYVRIVRRKFKGNNRFYVQLVLEGKPRQKYEAGDGTVGLDLGPSTIAAVGKDFAILETFCKELKSNQKQIRRVQRAMHRSLRAVNPDAWNADGTVKEKAILRKSKGYRRLQVQLQEMYRKLAAHRKTLHGTLANRILREARTINTEKLSYRAWHCIFGKSVGFRAPGMFVQMLRRKAESAGGVVNEFPTGNRLSQTCHCGSVKKKPLSQRWHTCECGVSAQRDLYSAFLAMHVAGENLDTCRAEKAWPGAEPLLDLAVSRYKQTAKDTASGRVSFGYGRSQSRSPGKVYWFRLDLTVSSVLMVNCPFS